MAHNSGTLFPVILKVPAAERRLHRKAQVQALSRLARQAARISAEKSGLTLTGFPKNDAGAPVPARGTCWSISHKTRFVAGVAATETVGIDIERTRDVKSAIMEYIADEKEWDTIGGRAPAAFFRFWTAKEAVLKAMGVGFTGLSRCRILKVVDEAHLIAGYDKREFVVHQIWFTCDHIAAITGNNRLIHWTLT